jgi:hypothetical protein
MAVGLGRIYTLFSNDHDEVWQALERLARECDISGEVETLGRVADPDASSFNNPGKEE